MPKEKQATTVSMRLCVIIKLIDCHPSGSNHDKIET